MLAMRPLAYVFPYAIAFWVVFFWAFGREATVIGRAQKASASGGAPDDKGSLRVVMLTQALGFAAAFFLASMPWGRYANPRAAFWIGLVMVIAGAVLRRLCFRALGASFTGEVRVRSDQRVVVAGPYRWARHPSYTAGILMITGVATALGSWVGTAVGFALAVIGYVYRVRVEERALTATLGGAYRDYAAGTKRFIPFVI
jgi:protein-S-isoprenylcysteine O-methyltransferase Ste14